ncbi:MAG: 6-phosphofructokinase [Spirochaetaceae bacterium]|nr:6-phosphofructokinase [Spirochaetaceae bacterium]
MFGNTVKTIGILTSGGDCPGLNSAIRGVVRPALDKYSIKVMGIKNGYRGLITGNANQLTQDDISGILTRGGTFLGTSREKPFKNPEKDFKTGKTPVESIIHNYEKWKLDALVVLGGNGTQTTASLLAKEGLNVIGLPKTIDNDLVHTDITFGFHTAVDVATEAIDRIHTTAHSHNRIMVIEVMGHKAGWLGLYAGIAGGADIVLLPEIPYNINAIAKHLKKRQDMGKDFSIVVVAEGALREDEALLSKKELKKARQSMQNSIGYRIAHELENATELESRVTVLGYLQRGGTPSPYDRVLATQFGAAALEHILDRDFGKMIALQNNEIVTVPLEDVAGQIKKVPLNHKLLKYGKDVGTCFGIEE